MNTIPIRRHSSKTFYTPEPGVVEAERAVLGAVLLRPDALPEIRTILGDDSQVFALQAHRRSFEAMLKLHQQGQPIDPVTLRGEDSGIEPQFIAELTNNVPQSANAVHYAEIVRASFEKRQLLQSVEEAWYRVERGDDRASAVSELVSSITDARNEATSSSAASDVWPEPLCEEAFHGPVGEFVRIVEPHTEADPAALLMSFLVAVGCALGPRSYRDISQKVHPPRLFGALVGSSSVGRKGTSFAPVERLLARAVPEFRQCIRTGLQSGEGILHHVRDAAGDDPGVEDKRLLCVEEELAGPLSAGQRRGSTLSPRLREAWDSGNFGNLAKGSSTRSTDAHVCLLAHCTLEELRRVLTETDQRNGLANRILWTCVRRSKVLPDGGSLDDSSLDRVADAIRAAVEFASEARRIGLDRDATYLWREVYPQLTAERFGLFGAVTSRAAPQVVRIALIYALLDCSEMIRLEHLRAALAVWRYAEQSARFIFQQSSGDRTADRILTELRLSENGLDRTQLFAIFNRHIDAKELEQALTRLIEAQLVIECVEPTAGRPRRRYVARVL